MVKLNLLRPKAIMITDNHNAYDFAIASVLVASVFAGKNLIKKQGPNSVLVFGEKNYCIINDSGRM